MHSELPGPESAIRAGSADAASLLQGAYDTHLHVWPDTVPRCRDFLGAAREAQQAGMAGIVFKDIAQPTTDRAHVVNALFPGLQAFGGVVLDWPVGGLNPVAVDRCLRHGGTFVWMPVAHSRHTVSLYQSGILRLLTPPDVPPARAISLVTDAGDLREEVREIVRLVAQHDAVLGTGHVSPEESIALLRYAAGTGVRRMVANHPSGRSIGASIQQQRAMAACGAFLEHCFAQCTPGLDNLPVEVIAHAIREIGPASCILAGDLGQTFNPPPAQGLGAFLQQLEAAGISRGDLRLMTHENPRRLLLEPR